MEERRLRVTKDGRLIIPKSVVMESCAEPGDFVDLTDRQLHHIGMTRAAFLRLLFSPAGAAIGFISSAITTAIGIFYSERRQQNAEIEKALMVRLFGGDNLRRVALAPARNVIGHGSELRRMRYERRGSRPLGREGFETAIIQERELIDLWGSWHFSIEELPERLRRLSGNSPDIRRIVR